jgi:hypothetical protein
MLHSLFPVKTVCSLESFERFKFSSLKIVVDEALHTLNKQEQRMGLPFSTRPVDFRPFPITFALLTSPLTPLPYSTPTPISCSPSIPILIPILTLSSPSPPHTPYPSPLLPPFRFPTVVKRESGVVTSGKICSIVSARK